MSSNDIVHLEMRKREDSIDKKKQYSGYTMFVLKVIFPSSLNLNKYHYKLYHGIAGNITILNPKGCIKKLCPEGLEIVTFTDMADTHMKLPKVVMFIF